MNLFLRIVILLLFGMTFFSAKAQKNLSANSKKDVVKEYVVLKDGTLEYGEILRDYDYVDYRTIEMKTSAGVKSFSPKDVQSFQLSNGRYFETLLLPDLDEETFVQVLFKGRFRLLNKKGNYYIESETGIDRLMVIYRESDPAVSKKPVKLYIGQLKILLAGKCGTPLYTRIDQIRLEESALIKLMIDYHKCEEIPFELYIKRIPFLKLSPMVGAGLGIVTPIPGENPFAMAMELSNSMRWMTQGGMRLEYFRRAPRLSADFRLGYAGMSGSWQTSISTSNTLLTGTEDYRLTTFFVPFGFNYSLLKKPDFEIYAGLIAHYDFNQMITENPIVDTQNKLSKEVILNEVSFLKVRDSQVTPGFKLGLTKSFVSGKAFFVEVSGMFPIEMMTVAFPLFADVPYDMNQVSFLAGFKF